LEAPPAPPAERELDAELLPGASGVDDPTHCIAAAPSANATTTAAAISRYQRTRPEGRSGDDPSSIGSAATLSEAGPSRTTGGAVSGEANPVDVMLPVGAGAGAGAGTARTEAVNPYGDAFV
jgi:hypothetical protein